MNMTRSNYPNPGNYVKLWKRVIEYAKLYPNQETQYPRGFYKTTTEIRQEFLNALNSRINTRGGLGIRGKKDNRDYFFMQYRDKVAIENKCKQRIRIYQFESMEAKKRFSYLLSSYQED